MLLTPHFYREEESVEEFLARRQASFDALMDAVGDEPMPKLVLGAEVYWYPGISREAELHKLCIEGTKLLLLELPYAPWTDAVLEEVDAIPVLTGLTPLIAHVDRYFHFQKNGQIPLLQQMGFPMQLNAAGFRGILLRRKLLPILRGGKCCIGSDCHGPEFRRPCMDEAAAYLSKRPDLQYALHWQPA